MQSENESSLLSDHVDARVITSTDEDQKTADRRTMVQLDPDHPGFRDPNIALAETRLRRSLCVISRASRFRMRLIQLTNIRCGNRSGALAAGHQKHACAEYRARQALIFPDHIPQLREVNEGSGHQRLSS